MDNSREYELDLTVAGLVDASRGWRYDGTPRARRNGRAAGADDRAVAVQRLLDRLDEDLAVRLRWRDRQRLRRTALRHPDALADAVLSANGLDPRVVPSVRGQVRDHVAEWLLTQPRTD